jgi:hypothetical protein
MALSLQKRTLTSVGGFLLDCTPYLADFLGEAAVFLKPNAGRQLLPEVGAQRAL